MVVLLVLLDVLDQVIVVVCDVVELMWKMVMYECQVVLEYCVICFCECFDELVYVLCVEVGKLINDVKGEVICLIDIFKIVVEEVFC